MADPNAIENLEGQVPRRVRRFVGVYDADHTLRGELAYWVGARLGRRHCSLCDITHGAVRQRPEWQRSRAGLPVPFDTYHRDDQPAPVRAAASGVAPVVVAELADGAGVDVHVDVDHVVVLGPDDLEACHGSIDAFLVALRGAMARHALVWDET